MKLIAAGLASARTYGLHITENCDRYWKLLNQTFRYTNTGQREARNR